MIAKVSLKVKSIGRWLSCRGERRERKQEVKRVSVEEVRRVFMLELCLMEYSVPSTFYRKVRSEESMAAWLRRREELMTKLNDLDRKEAEMRRCDFEEELDDFAVEFELWLLLKPFEMGKEDEDENEG
ncbi:hypothetical protein M422DRAFT_49844 [Sphaerobolus stellatus SS14]|uniref:Uncharacterized protein n=1 Tax=Sphaerobolus stellatus (strain SS14) TaxID=990650 RepID=A0A0C9VM61_SPHS4|nr:hypothetical protein M422DRAFT_49844 [Sphaerobolus stellatus SS14]